MAILRYTLLRVLIFAVLAALLWLAGLRGYLLLLAAVALSGVASVFVLRGSRDRLSIALDHRVSAIKDRLAERTRVEDAWNDAQEGLGHPQRRIGATGASTDAPGRDLDDLDDAPEVERNRGVS